MSETTKVNLRSEVALTMLGVLRSSQNTGERIEAAKVLLSLADVGMGSIEIPKKE